MPRVRRKKLPRSSSSFHRACQDSLPVPNTVWSFFIQLFLTILIALCYFFVDLFLFFFSACWRLPFFVPWRMPRLKGARDGLRWNCRLWVLHLRRVSSPKLLLRSFTVETLPDGVTMYARGSGWNRKGVALRSQLRDGAGMTLQCKLSLIRVRTLLTNQIIAEEVRDYQLRYDLLTPGNSSFPPPIIPLCGKSSSPATYSVRLGTSGICVAPAGTFAIRADLPCPSFR